MNEYAWAAASVLMYVAVFGLAIALHVRGHRDEAIAPSVGVALGWVMGTTTGRVVTLLFWSWVGFHFFAR
jgi:hypothetical protein